MARLTAAFVSYHHDVDALGDVTRFRKALEQGVRERGWGDFAVFQDREDIQWGDDWRDRVRASLDDVLLLLPVISPGLFQSEPCRLEMSTFLEREARNPGRKQIVLPVYFVTTPAYENGTDSLASQPRDRIYLDFRELRIRNTDDREYRQAILKASDGVAALLSASAAATATPQIAPADVKVPTRPEAKPVPESFTEAQPDRPSRPDTRRTPHKWRWLGAVTSVTGIAALILSVAVISPPGRHPAPPDPPVPPPDPHPKTVPTIVPPLQPACLIQRETQTFRQPETGTGFGPFLGRGQQIEVAGQVAGSDWLAARESDGAVYYFDAGVCKP